MDVVFNSSVYAYTLNKRMHVLIVVLTISIFSSNLVLVPSFMSVAAQLASQTFNNGLPNSNNFSTYTDYSHDFKVQHPDNWQPMEFSSTSGTFSIVTAFYNDAPPQTSLDIGFCDLTQRGNITLQQLNQQIIAEKSKPDVSSFNGEILSNKKIIQTDETVLANHTAHRVVWEERSKSSSSSDMDKDDNPEKKMEVWTIVGIRHGL